MKHIYLVLVLLYSIHHLLAQSTFVRVTDPDNPLVSFTNTQAPYRGAVWIDLDHDNLPDAYMSPRFLFRNTGNGQFEQLTSPAGATGGQGASGSSWADLDNDGNIDFINASAASTVHLGDSTGFVFENATTTFSGLTNFKAWDGVVADVDNNGLIDVLFVHARGFHSGTPAPCRFYLQTAAGQYEAVSGYEFTDQLAPYTIPVWTDYDLDGDLDLFIGSGPGNGIGPDFCYKNLLIENGAFTLQRLTAAPFGQPENGQVYNFIDVDNDGDQDGMLTNYIGAPTHFWKNTNGQLVEQQTPFTGATNTPFLSNAWGDLDNDGDLDVLISEDGSKQLRLYRNNGEGIFDNLEIAGEADTTICGVALADYDNDGDLDLLTNGPLGGRALFKNELLTTDRNWINIKLEGIVSNKSAIGARVRIKAMINGKQVWMSREVLARNSFQSQHDLRQHFGLGDAVSIDSLEIRWPSGLIQQTGALEAGHFYQIAEGFMPQVIAVTTTCPLVPSFRIWPNPTNGYFQIDASAMSSPIAQIRVYHSNGVLIAAEIDMADCNQYWLQLPEQLSAGWYQVHLVFEHGAVAVQSVFKYR